MSPTDLDQVLRIEKASFGSPWLREHFAYEIRHRGRLRGQDVERVADVLRDAGRVLGYLCAWILLDELKINNLAVAPEVRGRGVGRWLLRRLLERGRLAGCARASLEVRPSNAPALALYRAAGFAEVGRRPGYYERDGEDAIVMELDLAAEAGV